MGINAELQQINHRGEKDINWDAANFSCRVWSHVTDDFFFLRRDSSGVKMYAFYSLLVYIFYTVFKKEEEEDSLEAACGASSDVCLATY